jgi:FAD/FMN-containing dehydrogenase
MAKHGLAADNVLAVELVTADGRVLDVTADSDPDLFWALRGGGGNFGIAASIKFRLHPMPTVTGGLIGHPIEKAGEMLRFYRDAAPTVSDDLTVFAALVHAPDGSGMKLAGLVVFHTGTPEEAERDLAPFKEWGSPIMVEVGPVPYPVFNTILDEAYPHGLRNYWLSAFTNGLPDGLIDTMVERFEQVTSPMSGIVLEQFHGAVTRVAPAETAVPHRDEGYNLLITGVWDDAAADDANVAWTKESFAAMTEFFSGGRWLNYLGDDQGDDAVRGAYGANYDRLAELKRRYDPENVFHHNHNIAP